MSLMRHSATLFERESGDAATDDATGTSYRIKPSDFDSARDDQSSFAFAFDLTTSGGTSPTLDGDIEHSVDGTNWATLASITQITTATTIVEVETPTSSILPYVRAKLTAGGTADPTWYGKVTILSDAPFSLTT